MKDDTFRICSIKENVILKFEIFCSQVFDKECPFTLLEVKAEAAECVIIYPNIITEALNVIEHGREEDGT